MKIKIYLFIILSIILNAKSFYANWLSMETSNGKPVFSDVKANKPQSENYYKIFYNNKKIYKIEEIKNSKLNKTYIFNKSEKLKEYQIFTDTKPINCFVRYNINKKIIIKRVNCDNNFTYISKYINDKTLDNIVEIKTYKNKKLIKKREIDKNRCIEYNYETNRTNKFECYSNLEGAPINIPSEIEKIDYFKH